MFQYVSSSKTIFHRPKATQERKDMESLFLNLFRRFHIRQSCAEPDETWRTMEYRNDFSNRRYPQL